MNKDYLVIENITKEYGKFTALKDVSISIQKGELVCLLGPSGCGKTTLLRIVAGLEDHHLGKVYINGKDMTSLPPEKRNFGIVFQSYALFPNMNVYNNIAFGLKNKKLSKKNIDEKVKEVLQMVELEGIEKKYPSQLSGGQQQRVALARALALSPEFLLLDEPLSALDAKVRVKLRSQIRKIQKELGITTIMVTHDQEEALSMADRIVVMNNASVMQVGTPQEIYKNPANPFVADFIGSINFFEGQSLKDNIMAIRPEHIMITKEESDDVLEGYVRDMEFRGAFYRVFLSLMREETMENKLVVMDIPSNLINDNHVRIGALLKIKLPKERILKYNNQNFIQNILKVAG